MRFATIDWSMPWLAPYRLIGEPLAARVDWINGATAIAHDRTLHNAYGQPISFVPQNASANHTPYETHIANTGQVPTRDNLHDFFNALLWLHFPCTKRVLNQLQAAALSQASHQQASANGRRGPQRDSATLFDENAAIFISHDAGLIDALRAHEWPAVLHTSPSLFFPRADVILFGHALIEKLVTPYKSITAHVWTVQRSREWFTLSTDTQIAMIDHQLAAELTAGFDNAAFCHLPVLGVPGWWHCQDAEFYADKAVFRSKRLRD